MNENWTIQNKSPIDHNRLNRLRQIVGDGPVLIMTHDNPDPDALASGEALATLFEDAWGITSHLLYSGIVARAENKAMLNLLTPGWKHAESTANLEQYPVLALVDTQPTAGNNSLPDDMLPHIVIDHHHPIRGCLEDVAYVDVRPDIGATASLIYQYLKAAGIVPDSNLATAIFYGIQTDTRGLSRGDSPTDTAVYINLLSLIDRQALVRVEQAGLPQDYFRAFSKGLQAARIHGQAVLADIGVMHRPDFAAELADLLIRMEDAAAVLCLGTHGSLLYLSLRTSIVGEDAGLLIQRVIVPPGKAGGHGNMAGGQVPISGGKSHRIADEIERRFLAAMQAPATGIPLLS